MKQLIKGIINAGLKPFGCSIVGYTTVKPPPGRADRPIAEVRLFLEDIRARGFPCRGLLDVGANQGDWTRMAMEVFPEAKFLLVEPQVEMVPKLDALCREHKNVEYVLAGVGSKEG